MVGGKGESLLRMAAEDLPVPPGAVLTTSFFAPWLAAIRGTDTWDNLTKAGPSDWPPLCETLKAECRDLPFTPAQNDVLANCREYLRTRHGGDVLFAVRSSSPEEDLDSASFAGGYETRLGVSLDGLDDAVRHCVASSLDERVLVYKKEHDLDPFAPRLAVVVQRQIDSDVSGVGFSLNPVTNDYDEAVIDANWGLGTTVVDGRVSPDHFVVNKVDGRILEATTGEKDVSEWLDADGSIEARDEACAAERTLSDAQVQEITEVLCRIEDLYERPVDVEWAYADGRLYVLQARTIAAD
jgi:pyruvate,water dikinase